MIFQYPNEPDELLQLCSELKLESGDCADANEGIEVCCVANGFCCNGAGVCTIGSKWPC